ncbi:hypothetical protein GJ636_00005 [Leuconostoc citreum]|nr:hypothetical protein GJ636_00005 [Leuconostoc citreum]
MIQQAMEQDWSRDADSYLGLMWAQDSLDETFKPKTWVKSNPLLNLDSERDVLLQGLTKRDSDLLAAQLETFRKNLNMWLQESTNSYLKLSDVEQAIIPAFDIKGRQVYIDMITRCLVITQLSLLFIRITTQTVTSVGHTTAFFLPWEKAGSIEAKKTDGINYPSWQSAAIVQSHHTLKV